MSDVRLGALCWNQYTTWPALLEAGTTRRPPRLRHALDVGPPLPDRRQLGRAHPRGLADAGGVGPGHRADPDRPDGRREHVPRAGTDRQDGDDPRPHLRRAGHPRHRRGLVRGGAPRLRHPVRRRLPGAAALARRGAADHARHAPRRAPDGGRAALLGAGRPQRPAAASSSACRSSSAAAASRSRSSSSRATPTRTTSAAGSRPSAARRRSCSSTARRSDAIRPRSSGRPGSGTVIIRDSRDEARARPCRDLRAQRPAPSPGRTSRSARPRTSPSGSRPYLEIGYRHLVARLPVAARRGVDDPSRDRGPDEAGGRLTVEPERA